MEPLVGGYSASQKDESVTAAANFAVKAINAENNSDATLKSIDKVEKQVVAGLNFKMTLTLSDDKVHNVVVYRDLSQKFSLTSDTVV